MSQNPIKEAEDLSLEQSALDLLLRALDHPETIDEAVLNLANSEAGKRFQEEINRLYALEQFFDEDEKMLDKHKKKDEASLKYLLSESKSAAQKARDERLRNLSNQRRLS